MGRLNQKSNEKFATERVILLWSFAEVALGGVLHAFRIPFTGILVGSASVLCLCLLGFHPRQKGEIPGALAVVLAVKVAVTPHAPAGAFLAVGFQGLAAWTLFRFMGARPGSCILLGALALLQSSVQKVVFMTILYGMSLWQALDLLVRSAFAFFGMDVSDSVRPSLWIIAIYLFLHLFVGVLVGLTGSRLPGWIRQGGRDPALARILKAAEARRVPAEPTPVDSRRGKRLVKRGAGLVLTAVFVGILVGLDHETAMSPARQALLLLARVVTVALVYVFVLAPLVRRAVLFFSGRKGPVPVGRVASILGQLPVLKSMAAETMRFARAEGFSGAGRGIRLFLAAVLLDNAGQGTAKAIVED